MSMEISTGISHHNAWDNEEERMQAAALLLAFEQMCAKINKAFMDKIPTPYNEEVKLDPEDIVDVLSILKD